MDWNAFRSHIRHLPAQDQRRIERAFRMGKELHGGQLRKSGDPYFTHPVAVAEILADLGADGDTLVAALLHDAVEDTTATLGSIEEEFGHKVRNLIDGVTKLSYKGIHHKPTLDEQIENLRKIFTLMQQDVRIMVIKLADRLHNMHTIGSLTPERQRAFAQETMDVYVRIAERLSMHEMRDQLEELCLEVLDPQEYQTLKALRERSSEDAEDGVTALGSAFEQSGPLPFDHYYHEHSSLSALRAQSAMDAQGVSSNVPQITVVFVCRTIDRCYQTLGLLHQHWQSKTLSFEDFINVPLMNGYRGVHTTIILPDSTQVRCKIRTEEMDIYAKLGITTKCFGGTTTGVLDSLPWAEHISPLSEDTEDHSREFWESLQSDILGESIVIHGPTGEALSVPKNSTALDGAFYTMGTEALRTQKIEVNGQEVPFHSILPHGASLSVWLGKKRSAKREWLNWVETGLATAQIRGALGEESTDVKISTGKTILQDYMMLMRKGYLEEFNALTLVSHARQFGYETLNELLAAIADGYVEASEAFRILFPEKENASKDKQEECILRYSVALEDFETIQSLLLIRKKYRHKRNDLRFSYSPFAQKGVTYVRMTLTSKEQENLLTEIKAAGVEDVSIEPARNRSTFMLAATILMLLWGLDPVLAKLILNFGVDPLAFALERAWVIAIFSAVILFFKSRKDAFSRIPLNYVSLWIAGISFALVNVLTYLALASGSPALYNTILRGNSILLAIPFLCRQRRYQILAAIIVATAIGGGLLLQAVDFNHALLLSVGVLIAFHIYTRASRMFQELARVQARYYQFLFSTSVIAAVCLLPLLLVSLSGMNPFSVLIVALECIIFTTIPYMIFYHVTRIHGYAVLSPWITASLIVTFIGQGFFIGTTGVIPLILPAAMLSIASLFSAWIMRKKRA